MAIGLGTIFADVRLSLGGLGADANAAKAAFSDLENSFQGTALKFGALSLGIVVAVGAIGIKSALMAGDFQRSMNLLVTSAHESNTEIASLSNGVLNLAVATGTTTQDLTAGLYQIESGGYHGAQGLKVLTVAAEGAKAEGANLEDVAKIVTDILNDFGPAGLTAANAMNALIATVSQGQVRLQDLATALVTIMPTAANAGVSFYDMAGAMATMTGEGTRAANAATYLRQLIIALDAPSSKGAKALALIGLTAKEVANGMRISLPETIDMITSRLAKKFPEGAALANAEMLKVKNGTESFDTAISHLSNTGAAQYIAALRDIAGGSRQMQGILELSGTHLKTFGDNVKYIEGQVKAGGNSVLAWSEIQGNFNLKLDQAKEAIQTLMIRIGTVFLPILGQLLGAFATGLLPTLQNLFGFITHNQPVLYAFAGMMGTILVGAVYALATALWALISPLLIAAAPFLAVGAAIGLLVLGLKNLYDHSKVVRDIIGAIITIIGRVTSAIGEAFGQALQYAGQQLKEAEPALRSLGNAFNNVWSIIKEMWPVWAGLGALVVSVFVVAFGLVIGVIDAVAGAIRGLAEIFAGVVNFLVSLVHFFADLITGQWGKVPGDVGDIFKAIWQIIVGIVDTIIGVIGGFVHGVVMFFADMIDKLVGGHGKITQFAANFLKILGALPHEAGVIIVNLVNNVTSVLFSLVARAVKIAGDVVGGFIGVITSWPGKVTTWLINLKNAVFGFFSNAASWLIHAGEDLMNGLLKGIKNVPVLGGIVDIGQGIVGTVKNVFGSHSPSTVFAQIGEDLMTGLAQGVHRGSGIAYDALSTVSGGMSSGLSSSFAGGGGTTINVTVQVTPDKNENASPETAGRRFGTSLGTQIGAILSQRGH